MTGGKTSAQEIIVVKSNTNYDLIEICFLNSCPMIKDLWDKQFSSVQFTHSVRSDFLRPHELQHARPPWDKQYITVNGNIYLSFQMWLAFKSSLVQSGEELAPTTDKKVKSPPIFGPQEQVSTKHSF